MDDPVTHETPAVPLVLGSVRRVVGFLVALHLWSHTRLSGPEGHTRRLSYWADRHDYHLGGPRFCGLGAGSPGEILEQHACDQDGPQTYPDRPV